MSHYTPLLDLLPERIMFLYGSLLQGNVQFNQEGSVLTLTGVDIPYDSTTIDQHISEIDTLISTYEQEDPVNEDMILTLEDIKRVLQDTKDRLSWLQ